MGKVRAICVSEKRGVGKMKVEEAIFCRDFGLWGMPMPESGTGRSAFSPRKPWMRFKKAGAEVSEGDFGENLVVEGFNFKELPVGTLLRCGDVLLEISRSGKNAITIVPSIGQLATALCQGKGCLPLSGKEAGSMSGMR